MRGLELPSWTAHIEQFSLNSFVCVLRICLFKVIKSLLVQPKVSKHLKNCIWLDKLLSFETTVDCMKLLGKLFETDLISFTLSFNFNGSVHQLVFQKSNKRMQPILKI